MRQLWRTVVGQERAVANAREAATVLSRRRVEREEVAQFLEDREAVRRREPQVARHAPTALRR